MLTGQAVWRLIRVYLLTFGGSITVRLVSSVTSLHSPASLHSTITNVFIFSSNPILLNWRQAVKWKTSPKWWRMIEHRRNTELTRENLTLVISTRHAFAIVFPGRWCSKISAALWPHSFILHDDKCLEKSNLVKDEHLITYLFEKTIDNNSQDWFNLFSSRKTDTQSE